MPFQLTSRVFKEGEAIPVRYAGEGEDVSPPLDWQDPPVGSKSFALVCEDPDAPGGTFVHWVLYNTPPNPFTLPEAQPGLKALPTGIRQGLNDFGMVGYKGPHPPKGKPHRYFFKLYALDAPLDLAPGAKRAELEKAIGRHVLGEAQLMGTYQRT